MAPDAQNPDPSQTPDAQPDQVAEELTPEAEIERLKAALATEADRRLRGLAEVENLKKRLIKEKEDFQKYATESLIADLLPVLDHLDMALTHGREIEACKDFMVGVEMTRKAFVDILSHHGVVEFGQVGDPFSPETHEAIGMMSEPILPADSVGRVMQRGYMLRGRLLRPAKVVVNKPA